jgi:hypothetical protein
MINRVREKEERSTEKGKVKNKSWSEMQERTAVQKYYQQSTVQEKNE